MFLLIGTQQVIAEECPETLTKTFHLAEQSDFLAAAQSAEAYVQNCIQHKAGPNWSRSEWLEYVAVMYFTGKDAARGKVFAEKALKDSSSCGSNRAPMLFQYLSVLREEKNESEAKRIEQMLVQVLNGPSHCSALQPLPKSVPEKTN